MKPVFIRLLVFLAVFLFAPDLQPMMGLLEWSKGSFSLAMAESADLGDPGIASGQSPLNMTGEAPEGEIGGSPGSVKSLFDFESGTLDQWEIISGGFGKIITDRATFYGGQPHNKQGQYFLSTLDTPEGPPSDLYVGELRSMPFQLRSPKVSFLIAGGNKDVSLAICQVNGTVIRAASGNNSEIMTRIEWDLRDFTGQELFLKIVDTNQGSWGHLTFDDFQADAIFNPATVEQWRRKSVEKQFEKFSEEVLPFKEAVLDLAECFPTRYRDTHQELIQELSEFDTRFNRLKELALQGDSQSVTDADNLFHSLMEKKGKALLDNPLLQEQPLLFVSRKQYPPDHHNTETLFLEGEINEASYNPPGKIKILNPVTGETKILVDAGETGLTRDPEISWDGKRVLFSMRKSREEGYNIYEMDLTGTGLHRLTSLSGVSDIDPVYLPDGRIVMSSTRDPKYCMCNRHIMANLYCMDGDGANIHQISNNTLFDGQGSVMQDGRILYNRWEYVDRNFGDAQGLWTVNPDGTLHSVFYGNNKSSPGGVINGREIPGSQQVVCIFVACHDRPWGAMAIIDRNQGVDGREPVVKIWPPESLDLVHVEGWNPDLFAVVRPRYEDPYPLADLQTGAGAGKYFLCARTLDHQTEQTGVYLVDVFGNEVLVYREEEGMGCFDPMPILSRSSMMDASDMPPSKQIISSLPLTRPSLSRVDNKNGSFYIQDVYEGQKMRGVERGEVKFLRVVETPEKQSFTNAINWNGQGAQFPAVNWQSFETKRIQGTVPVEEDGSAYFEAPPNRFIYFQLLDKDGKMIQSMRSGTVIQPGEIQGCIGCHEDRNRTPSPISKSSLALERPPSPMGQGYGVGKGFSYLDEVQPVLDRHCLKCHDIGGTASDKVTLSGDKEVVFNFSYAEIWKKGLIKVTGGGISELQEAKSWGSHASRLTQCLEGHHDVRLTDEEKQKVYTWIDLNGVYYGTYDSAYVENPTGRCPISEKEMNRLGEICQFKPSFFYDHPQHPGALISFDRPELSPCVKPLDVKSQEYQEALALIQKGKDNLAAKPRADMPGFIPAPFDQQRHAKYMALRDVEDAYRKAILEGRKAYDVDMQGILEKGMTP
jgi:hypothetical protein